MQTDNEPQIIHPASTLRDLELTATIPQEMVASQKQLIDWVGSKIAVVLAERDDLWMATESAASAQWKTATLKAQYRNAVKRVEFYEKMKTALEQGYYIVPNFPIQLFAVRHKKSAPARGDTTDHWSLDHRQDAQELPSGEGEYRNPFPIVRQRKVQQGDKQLVQSWAEEWDDIEFPLTMAKAQIMEATREAMNLRVFDQIGIMPATKKEDPVIIGQIFRRGGYSTKTVSFMIAWHLNTNVL